jgi:SIR2-like protein
MRDLGLELAERLRTVVQRKRRGKRSLRTLVNDVITADIDFEHVITFLDESSSALHRTFADDLRKTFESVLRARLQTIEMEQGGTPDGLYAALLDMYEVRGLPEELRGFLTLNYDGYLESAISRSTRPLDAGVSLSTTPTPRNAIRVLKLHGSFSWDDTWPITTDGESTLWIPPGFQKAKGRYPFNLLWGLARELLDCDILRIIGCRLGTNDWDLISLLFSTRHTSSGSRPYRIEIIDAPSHAEELRSRFPYLGVQSLLELEGVGAQLVGEFSAGAPRSYQSLTSDEQDKVRASAGTGKNWFQIWLKQKAEFLYQELGSIETSNGLFERVLSGPA